MQGSDTRDLTDSGTGDGFSRQVDRLGADAYRLKHDPSKSQTVDRMDNGCRATEQGPDPEGDDFRVAEMTASVLGGHLSA